VGHSATINYAYDVNGNAAGKTDARGVVVNYGYDQLNRLTQKSYANDPTGTAAVRYGYDAVPGAVNCPSALGVGASIGRRTSMCDAAGSESWSYSITHNVGWQTVDQRTTNGVTKTITTQENLAGLVSTLTYPSGRIVTYTPGAAGRALAANDAANGINYASAAIYAPFGGLTGMSNGGAITVSNSYNARMQPLSLGATGSAGSILSLVYDFHAGNGDNGNVFQVTNGRDGNRTQNFTYDPLNRIAQGWSSGPAWGEKYTIDAWGNLSNRDGIAGKTYYEPLAAPANTNNQPTGFGYDAAGNMTNNGAYVYDAENRIKTTAGVTYTYDGDGYRVMKSNGTIYWGPGPLAESDLNGGIQREFVFFNGKRTARLDLPSGLAHYYFSDELGSTDLVTNATGGIENESDYYPYGGEQVITQTLANQNYKFTGKERDAESGLDDFGARYYGSALGRFLTPDWAARPTAVP
jgi:RHS repeat-associated protein